jgi:hypothetical protein
MFSDAMTKLDPLETGILLQELNPKIEGSPYRPDQTVILAMDMPFYPGYRFLELSDHSIMPARRTPLVYGPYGVTPLDWTNAPIYQLNETVPIALNEKTIGYYVRFFFTYVRGRHGRFLIVESVDDISWKDEPPPVARKAIGELIAPVQVRGIDPDGSYTVAVRMMFKDSLFKTNVRISPKGVVTMQDEELVVEDIPVLDDVLG